MIISYKQWLYDDFVNEITHRIQTNHLEYYSNVWLNTRSALAWNRYNLCGALIDWNQKAMIIQIIVQ